MRRVHYLYYLLPLILLGWLGSALASHTGSRPAPVFTQHIEEMWINSPPLTLDQLKGRVVLLDFWTSDCWNCYRSFPWLKGVERQYHGKPLQVIGIHTPEFEHEKSLERIQQKVTKYGLSHPVMVDNDYAYWNAIGNRYWPTYYLIDKQGNIRYHFSGETHADTSRANTINAAINTLLAE